MVRWVVSRMSNVLVITKSEKSAQGLITLLQQEGFDNFQTAQSAEKAKLCIAMESFDVVFIYTPLEDEIGINLSVYMTEHTTAGVFIAVSSDTVAKVGNHLIKHGIVAVEKPVNAGLLHQCVMSFKAFNSKIRIIQQENKKLKEQIEEVKLINRAKCVLMQCLAMSEPQAHKYLEKQAMDLRLSKKRIAEQVLTTYEM